MKSKRRRKNKINNTGKRRIKEKENNFDICVINLTSMRIIMKSSQVQTMPVTGKKKRKEKKKRETRKRGQKRRERNKEKIIINRNKIFFKTKEEATFSSFLK